VSKDPEDELITEENTQNANAAPPNADPYVYPQIALQQVLINSAKRLRAKVSMTLVLSIAAHWFAVVLTFYTRPLGFGCRSKYLTVISSIWTFNSIVCFIFYYLLDRPPPGVDTENDYIHIWFQICGVVIFVFLIAFGVLSHDPSWWVAVFGNSCDVSSCLPG